jgi:hypothetical protein
LGALVFCLLGRKERLHAGFFDLTQVLDHAHLVLPAVALVEPLQPGTREVTALKAEPYSAVEKGWTLALDKAALLVTGTTAGAVDCLASLPGDNVRPSQVGTADAAVHSTRSNQSLFHAVSCAAA